MQKYLVIMLLIFIACASTSKGFKEPSSEDSIMVVGNIIFENNYYNDQLETVRKDIEVAVVGKYGAGEKIHSYWVTTDENGFFALADVPKGKYAIQGFRVYLGQGELLTIANSLRYEGSFYQIQRKPYVVFQADYFPIESDSRVYKLKYNHFWIDQSTRASAEVQHRIYDKVENMPLVNGQKLTLPPIEQYFVEKFPASLWAPILKSETK